MRNKLFALPLAIIVLLTSYFVTRFIVDGLYTQITAVWVMAAFTVVLAIATIWNIKITQDLLKQSGETFKQSRISFLVDIVDRTIEHVESLPDYKIAEQARYVLSKSRTIGGINKEMGLDFLQAMRDWSTARSKLQKKIEESIKKRKKERNYS